MAGLMDGVGGGALGVAADEVAHVLHRRADRPVAAGGPGEGAAGDAGERVALGDRRGEELDDQAAGDEQRDEAERLPIAVV